MQQVEIRYVKSDGNEAERSLRIARLLATGLHRYLASKPPAEVVDFPPIVSLTTCDQKESVPEGL